jgi:3D (Asp-Asp-Asp) domain-containing protein
VLGLALVALGFGASLPGAEGARVGKPGADLVNKQARPADRSQVALLNLYALDARLAQARAELGRLRARTQAATLELAQARQEAALVTGNLRASQRLLGDHLRRLYEQGEPNAIAVLLGATSLDEAVTRLEELDRIAHQGARAVNDARDGRAKLQDVVASLLARIRELETLQGQAERATAALVSARAQRVGSLASLARQRQLTKQKIAVLSSQASRSAARGQAVQQTAQSSPSTPAPESTVVSGARTLTVTATGYSLPGRTALGLLVGPGIVAVDPAVIPLGTRLTIPGYGEGIAADTGGAVQGYAIDLWFPTLGDALAWGRRTVTVTLH